MGTFNHKLKKCRQSPKKINPKQATQMHTHAHTQHTYACAHSSWHTHAHNTEMPVHVCTHVHTQRTHICMCVFFMPQAHTHAHTPHTPDKHTIHTSHTPLDM